MSSKSLTFLTRYYPPSRNINGESIWDMVDYIQKNHPKVECHIVHIDHNKTTTGGTDRTPVGTIHKVKSYLNSDFSLIRGIKLILDSYLLVRKAKKIENTTYVITTSPPLLPFVVGLFLGKKRKRAFWALDLFPESFKAKGVIRENNPIYKWMIKKSYNVDPEFIIALGPKQAEYIASQCYKNADIKVQYLPCGFFEEATPVKEPDWLDKDKIMFGYLGNIHDAHNPSFVINMIDAINPQKHKLILALYGNKSESVKEYAKGKLGVYLTDSVPRNELRFIDVHLVSLLPRFTHFAVPSKAVSAVTMGKSILFCGNKESDSWYLFKENGWYIEDDENMKQAVKSFCDSITKEEVFEKLANAEQKTIELKEMVNSTYEYVANY